jgi:tetratricopeptide (TPR) repeat protein
LIPVGKWALAALALTPMGLSLTASLSPDGPTNSLSFLLVAQVMACAIADRTTLTPGILARIALLGAGVGLAKQMYFFLPACYLLIPAGRAASRRGYWAGFAVVMGSTFLAVLAWGLVVRRIWSPADPTMGLDPGEQLRRMIVDPVEFLRVLGRTAGNVRVHGREYVGQLGWAEVGLPTWVYVSEVVALTLICVKEFGRGSGLSAAQALVAAGVSALVVLTIAMVIHLTWDTPGVPYIALHGRYFIPISPLLGIVLGRIGFCLPASLQTVSRAVPALVGVVVPVLLAASLIRLYDRYFVDTAQDASERHSVRGTRLIGAGSAADLERARAEFEESVKLNPANAVSHNWLGLMLKESDPLTAEAHFRSVLQNSPENDVALFELANILAGQAEFAEAIPLYREALRVSQGNPEVVAALRTAVDTQHAVQRDLQTLTREFHELVQTGMIEQREGAGGRFLKHNRGPVNAGSPQSLAAKMAFYWRSPPPDGTLIQLPDALPAASVPRRLPFLACSGKRVFSKRVFVFPAPVSARLLADEAVSWYYQLPMTALSEEERGREEAYRRARGLRFPLTVLPE